MIEQAIRPTGLLDPRIEVRPATSQVDDLLDRFRSHYRGGHKTPLPELRAAYDRLLMKVLSLLQDGDPALAKKIVSSREAIWGILSDPKKFSDNKLMAGA